MTTLVVCVRCSAGIGAERNGRTLQRRGKLVCHRLVGSAIRSSCGRPALGRGPSAGCQHAGRGPSGGPDGSPRLGPGRGRFPHVDGADEDDLLLALEEMQAEECDRIRPTHSRCVTPAGPSWRTCGNMRRKDSWCVPALTCAAGDRCACGRVCCGLVERELFGEAATGTTLRRPAAPGRVRGSIPAPLSSCSPGSPRTAG